MILFGEQDSCRPMTWFEVFFVAKWCAPNRILCTQVNLVHASIEKRAFAVGA